MRYQCEILNPGIRGYEVWLHGRNQKFGYTGVTKGAPGLKAHVLYLKKKFMDENDPSFK